jgi:hypothetical protein
MTGTGPVDSGAVIATGVPIRRSRRRRFGWSSSSSRIAIGAVAILSMLLLALGPALIGTASAVSPLDCVAYVPVSASVSPNTTNVTVSWTIGSPSSVYLEFGMTTSYGFVEVNYTVYAAGSYKTLINYLEPDTTYYYHIIAARDPPLSGICPGTYSGSWTTGGWSNSQSGPPVLYVSGTVNNTHGVWATSGLAVTVTCTDPTYDVAQVYQTPTEIGEVGSNGAYKIQVNWLVAPLPCVTDHTPLIVNVTNAEIPFGGTGTVTSIWAGYWNESIIIYQPQVVDFTLPSNFVGPYQIEEVGYSNANATNGWSGGTSITFETGTSVTTGSTVCSSAFFFGGCTSSTVQYTDENGCSSTVGTDAESQKWMTSGRVEYNATVRQVGIIAEQDINESGLAECPAEQTIQPWVHPWTNLTLYLLKDWGNNNGQSTGVPVREGHSRNGAITVSTTTAVTGIQTTVAVSVEVSLPGAGVGFGTSVASVSWSQTGSTTVLNTLAWTAFNYVSSSYPMCFVAYGAGGSESENTTDFIGLWEYLPQYTNDSYNCNFLPS